MNDAFSVSRPTVDVDAPEGPGADIPGNSDSTSSLDQGEENRDSPGHNALSN